MRLHAIGDCVIANALDFGVLHDSTDSPSIWEELGRADLVLGNLEAALTDEVWPVEKASVLKVSPCMARQYAGLSVDAWSLANNHMLDYGTSGLLDTLAALSSAGIASAGAGRNLGEATAPALLEARSGERIAFFSFSSCVPPGFAATADHPGIAPLRVVQSFAFDGVRLEEQPGTPPIVRTQPYGPDLVRAEQAVAAVRDSVDVVIMALHWGVPWCFLPANQGPLAEYQETLACRLIDAGVDVIIGHHPHALHPVSFYHGGAILYSVGNFIFHESAHATVPSGTGEVRRPVTVGLKPILRSGPWYESAICVLEGRRGAFAVSFTPIHLGNDGVPVLVAPEAGSRVVADVVEASMTLNGSVRLDGGGRMVASQ